ncbi:hypothetical protein GCM10020258_34050 [Sphingomonas yabuuchiae]
MRFKYAGAIEGFRLDTSGNLLVGTSSAVGGGHVVAKPATEGQVIAALSSTSTGSNSLIAYAVTQQGWPAAAAAVVAGRNSQTNRSINAGGTVNASGADYAEYMIKAAGCGIIAKGDVCGVDRDGKLTKTWADAISFVVKSTDPSLVGGDTWSAHLPARPEQADDEADDAFASRLTEWEALLEKARQCVDRIAFCGQVPCNVTGDFEVGDYIVAAASGAGIKAVAVKPDDIAFPSTCVASARSGPSVTAALGSTSSTADPSFGVKSMDNASFAARAAASGAAHDRRSPGRRSRRADGRGRIDPGGCLDWRHPRRDRRHLSGRAAMGAVADHRARHPTR